MLSYRNPFCREMDLMHETGHLKSLQSSITLSDLNLCKHLQYLPLKSPAEVEITFLCVIKINQLEAVK